MTPDGIVRLKFDEAIGGKPPLRAYQDTGGVWTIGWGCTGRGIGPGVIWTLGQAETALADRIAEAESALRRDLAWFADLQRTDPVRADVLVNIAFNVGVNGLEHWPVTLAAVQARKWGEAADDILGNAKWESQVHGRDDRCAAAMRTGTWSMEAPSRPARPAAPAPAGQTVEIDL